MSSNPKVRWRNREECSLKGSEENVRVKRERERERERKKESEREREREREIVRER